MNTWSTSATVEHADDVDAIDDVAIDHNLFGEQLRVAKNAAVDLAASLGDGPYIVHLSGALADDGDPVQPHAPRDAITVSVSVTA